MCVAVVLFASSKGVCKQREMLQTKEEGKARVAAVFVCVYTRTNNKEVCVCVCFTIN